VKLRIERKGGRSYATSNNLYPLKQRSEIMRYIWIHGIWIDCYVVSLLYVFLIQQYDMTATGL